MGLFRRNREFGELTPIPPISDLPPARLQCSARYLGTLTQAGDRVIGRTLSARSSARLSLSAEALDVVRIAGSFRIPVGSLLGARNQPQFAGKPVPDLLVVRWEHDGNDWETGFRLEADRSLKDSPRPPQVVEWVRTISKLARGNR